MKRPTCETCPYWDNKPSDINYGFLNVLNNADPQAAERYRDKKRDGDCRLNPDVKRKFSTDWCGRHPDFRQWMVWLLEQRVKEDQ
jgi:hypothetical protein